jgi:UDP-N-acetylglucosamine:LPS N-acetylglucosamine transferase
MSGGTKADSRVGERALALSKQNTTKQKPRVLAIASGGGHWVQLLRLRPAFEGAKVTFVSVRPAYASDVPGERFIAINDATRWDKVGLARMAFKLLWIMLRVRPNVVISTGAAPGYFAIRLGKLLGARTIWLDSIANVEEMSMTGMLVKDKATLWLTQWPHLAGENGPKCHGSVL